MGIISRHRLFSGHAIFGGPPSNDQLHPIAEAELCEPTSAIWRAGNLYIRLFPDELRRCLGERLLRMYDPSCSPEAQAQAKHELKTLRTSVRRYFRRSVRRAGRPPKLTRLEREQMSGEDDRLRRLIRKWAGSKPPSPARLSQLFADPEFLKQLFELFPLNATTDPGAWPRFLQKTAGHPLAERCHAYLALRYGVGVATIRQAIWPREKTASRH